MFSLTLGGYEVTTTFLVELETVRLLAVLAQRPSCHKNEIVVMAERTTTSADE